MSDSLLWKSIGGTRLSQQGHGRVNPESPSSKCPHGIWKGQEKVAIYCNFCAPGPVRRKVDEPLTIKSVDQDESLQEEAND